MGGGDDPPPFPQRRVGARLVLGQVLVQFQLRFMHHRQPGFDDGGGVLVQAPVDEVGAGLVEGGEGFQSALRRRRAVGFL